MEVMEVFSQQRGAEELLFPQREAEDLPSQQVEVGLLLLEEM